MTSPIDLCADIPDLTLPYKLAVMQAALEGKPVQCNHCYPECPGHGWWSLDYPKWD